MKVKKSIRVTRTIDIGPVTIVARLPTEGRIRRGQKTTCAVCATAITDPYFLVAIAPGEPNMMIHEACSPDVPPQPAPTPPAGQAPPATAPADK